MLIMLFISSMLLTSALFFLHKHKHYPYVIIIIIIIIVLYALCILLFVFLSFQWFVKGRNKCAIFLEILEISRDQNKVNEVTKNCTECSICLNEFNYVKKEDKNVLVLKQCGHKFHRSCIRSWFMHSKDQLGKRKYTCPTCRTPLPKCKRCVQEFFIFKDFKGC